MSLNFDTVVIGSGPAGITAAIYLKRANLNVLMIDNNAPGGQINRIATIDNYPGFSKISGPDLAYNMFMQTQDLGIPYKYGKVINIIDEKDYKIVKTDKEEFKCKTVIIASGRKPRELGLENEKKLIGRGISWCAICDGALFKDKVVIVVGGGNSALDESIYLSSIASKVYIIHRGKEFSAEEIYQERVLKNPKVEICYNSSVSKLNTTDNKLSSIIITNNETEQESEIMASAMFIYIGFEPSIDYANKLNLITDNGYIIVDNNMKTNIDGIFACGDIIKKDLYQITTAVSEGSIAAMGAIKYTEKFKDNYK
jgi:thioredoxin reductase (NADPH)